MSGAIALVLYCLMLLAILVLIKSEHRPQGYAMVLIEEKSP